MDLIPVKCANCGNDGDDAELVLIKQVVGQVVIGMKADGTIVGDGEPVYFDRQPNADHIVWCDACGSSTLLISMDGEDEDDGDEES